MALLLFGLVKYSGCYPILKLASFYIGKIKIKKANRLLVIKTTFLMNKALFILRGNSHAILYDQKLKGCVYKSVQIFDLTGLK